MPDGASTSTTAMADQRDKSKHDKVLTVAARLPAARRRVNGTWDWPECRAIMKDRGDDPSRRFRGGHRFVWFPIATYVNAKVTPSAALMLRMRRVAYRRT